jgi:hypothetical protein
MTASVPNGERRSGFGLGGLFWILTGGENVAQTVTNAPRRQLQSGSAFTTRRTAAHGVNRHAIELGVFVFRQYAL